MLTLSRANTVAAALKPSYLLFSRPGAAAALNNSVVPIMHTSNRLLRVFVAIARQEVQRPACEVHDSALSWPGA